MNGDRGRDWSCSHRPGSTWDHQKLEEARKDASLEPSEGARHCQHLDFRLTASRTVRGYISGVLSHIRGNLTALGNSCSAEEHSSSVRTIQVWWA